MGRGVINLIEGCKFEEKHLRDQSHRIRERLLKPLTIAVTGRVSSGKSTLVNALVSMKISPTGVGETTRLLYRFECGDYEKVRVKLRDGSIATRFLTLDGHLPDEFGAGTDEIQEVSVSLPSAPFLKRLSILDTPGISSAIESNSIRTIDAIFSGGGPDEFLPEADALLFILRGMEDEVELLRLFHSLTDGGVASAVNVIGVLTQADRIGALPDPIESLVPRIRRLCREPSLRMCLATIVPIIGLLGETGEVGLVDWEDIEMLDLLNRISVHEREDLLASADDFLSDYAEVALDVSLTSRRTLLDKMGLYGVRLGIAAVDSGARDPSALNELLLAKSGLTGLRSLMHELFEERADVLKADVALRLLERLSYQTDTQAGATLRGRIEALRLEPRMHRVREAWAVGACSKGENGPIPPWLEGELLRLALNTDSRRRAGLSDEASRLEIYAAAQAGASRAHAYASNGLTSARQAQIAEVVRASYTLMCQQALSRSQ